MKRVILAILMLTMLAGCGGEPEAEPEVRTQPPGLSVESGGGRVEAGLSTYSWSNRQAGDQWECRTADYLHPLDILEEYPILETDAAEAVLVFEEEPDECSQVIFWREEAFTDTHSPEEEGTVEDGVVQLEEGLCLYVVTAQWERKDWSGTVSYVFQLLLQ